MQKQEWTTYNNYVAANRRVGTAHQHATPSLHTNTSLQLSRGIIT